MKKIILLILLLLTIGCNYSDITEKNKNEYIKLKEELSKTEQFQKLENFPFDITISLDRLTEEELTYRIIIDNAKEDLKDIKALLIHNYFTEDIFPSIGILDDTISIKKDAQDLEKGFMLVGYINTKENLEDIKIEFRLLVEYTTNDNITHKIYYKTTNFS